MLEVEYRGGLGNRMFQHSFGRLAADEYGMKFCAPRIDEFPDLVTEISGLECINGTITIEQDSKHPVLLSASDIETRCRGFKIVLRGFFESALHYVQHRDRIRTSFKIPERVGIKDAVAIHVRGTDAEPWRLPPLEYYLKAIECFGHETFVIYTDDPHCDYVMRINEHIAKQPVFVVSTNAIGDFFDISRHDQIIIGNSTFAWWAAFLSRATTIIQPEPINGWRSPEYPNSCLRVPEWVGIKYENEKG